MANLAELFDDQSLKTDVPYFIVTLAMTRAIPKLGPYPRWGTSEKNAWNTAFAGMLKEIEGEDLVINA